MTISESVTETIVSDDGDHAADRCEYFDDVDRLRGELEAVICDWDPDSPGDQEAVLGAVDTALDGIRQAHADDCPVCDFTPECSCPKQMHPIDGVRGAYIVTTEIRASCRQHDVDEDD